MNFRDFLSLAIAAAAIYFGKLEYDKQNHVPAPAPNTPAAIVAIAGTPANFGIACAGLADNVDADAKALRPVLLYSIDAQETVKAYFERPFAANIKANQAAAITKLLTDVATACGEGRTELSTDRRAALVALLRATAAANK